MIAASLTAIAADLEQLLADASDDPIDSFLVGVICRRLREQADMLTKGLDG